MLISDDIRALILQKKDANSLRKVAVREGMQTLRNSAIEKVFNGITSIEEVIRVVNAEENEAEDFSLTSRPSDNL